MKILPAPDYKLFEDALTPLWEAQNLADNAPADKQKWAFAVEDDFGHVVGGVGGYIKWGWMYVQHLIVAPEHRGKGLGRDLMFKAEKLARESELKGMHLKTLGFQAPDFYTACGFETVGTIADMPPGSTYYVMAKRF